MSNDWPTKAKDLYVAQVIMEAYASQQDEAYLGLFELTVNKEEKRMGFRLSQWVLRLAEQYQAMYGSLEGDTITRRVISDCFIQGETLH